MRGKDKDTEVQNYHLFLLSAKIVHDVARYLPRQIENGVIEGHFGE